ncbi:MAG: glycosyl hydrolase [Acidobacteriota bacterium]
MKKTIFLLFFLGIFLLNLNFLNSYGNSKNSPAPDEKQKKGERILKKDVVPKPTDPVARLKSFEHHANMKNESIFKNLKWRSVGPQFMGGRVTDIAVPPGNHFTIYVAVASGNVWKTVNNGTTWESIFENESTFTIGDIAVSDSDPNIIWVGTGESNSSRSSYAGTGIFKSIDGGKTWQNMGLNDTHHIGRIIIDSQNPDVVYVAAIGHLYTDNEERGLFKTTDGGKTWNKILYISDKVGVIDVVMDPVDNKTLYAAAWERSRKAWNFIESGEGSGVYKSTDAGLTWKKLTNGFPVGKHVGRIGLDVSFSNPNVVYAILDNQALRPEEKKKEQTSGITIDQLNKMSKEEFLRLDPKVLTTFLRENNVPREYTAEIVLEMVKKGELTPQSLAQYLLDANRRLFETNVIGAEVYRSDDKGETWRKVNEKYIDGFYNTYGYYFGNIRVSPDNENNIYILGVPLLTSDDGGKRYKNIGGRGVHGDHHALWIDPKNPDRLLLGNDGGLNFSYDRGKTWQKINNLPIGQFYTIAVDMDTPYSIYGGLQDNGVVYGPNTHIPKYGVDDPWKTIYGGDGAYVQIDPTDSTTIYAEYQFGNISRISKKDRSMKNIMPKAKIGEPPLRYNWQTPFLISYHNPFILYYGANKLFKSLNRGDSWICISPDLTTNPGPERQGDVPYGTITTISESPIKPGLIYVGTDDGNVYITQNDGVTWTKINKGLPDKWVSRVVASRYEEGTVYVSLTGYRDDDFEKYLFMSTDFGKTWKSIASNLPSESINVIREDPRNKNILYAGTDLGIYISIDRGKTWNSLRNNLPTTPVHDLIVHPRDNELVIGTHGRSVFVLNVENIQKFDEKIQEKEAHLFDIKPVSLPQSRWEKGEEAVICYYLRKTQQIKISIIDETGNVIKELKGTNDAGLNIVTWDLTFEERKETREEFPMARNYVKPGNYKVEILAGDVKLEGKIQVKAPSSASLFMFD